MDLKTWEKVKKDVIQGFGWYMLFSLIITSLVGYTIYSFIPSSIKTVVGKKLSEGKNVYHTFNHMGTTEWANTSLEIEALIDNVFIKGDTPLRQITKEEYFRKVTK